MLSTSCMQPKPLLLFPHPRKQIARKRYKRPRLPGKLHVRARANNDNPITYPPPTPHDVPHTHPTRKRRVCSIEIQNHPK